jgi:hypothetical protein
MPKWAIIGTAVVILTYQSRDIIIEGINEFFEYLDDVWWKYPEEELALGG